MNKQEKNDIIPDMTVIKSSFLLFNMSKKVKEEAIVNEYMFMQHKSLNFFLNICFFTLPPS